LIVFKAHHPIVDAHPVILFDDHHPIDELSLTVEFK
jgi:hypothetical protein